MTPNIHLNGGNLALELNPQGRAVQLTYRPTNESLLAEGGAAPILRVGNGGAFHDPVSAEASEGGTVRLEFGASKVAVQAEGKETHLRLEIVSVEGEMPEAAQWGPFKTNVQGSIGETVGVARGETVAVGIQALSMQTAGGHAGCGTGHHEHAAAETEQGADLQAYARDADGGLIGSKIALFACPREEPLETIGQIELAEGLPHPVLDGEWTKTSKTAREAYMIAGFSEENLDELIEYAQRAGLRYLYHGHPFATWGRFQLGAGSFPDGDESLIRCSRRAAQKGFRLGLHTLTNFITTNDPYVSPKPDARLRNPEGSRLAADVDAEAAEIPIENAEPFKEKGALSAVLIGGEIVQYEAVEENGGAALVGCQRGAFNTQADAHQAGARVGKLIDHPYRVFFPDLEMQDEMIDRLVEIYNKADIRQISFDGLEGCDRTDHGAYAHHRFVQRFYDGCGGEIVNDASRLLHYNWHIHTRMNWGEPWGAAMRDGMPEYRFKNQAYFERNLFPPMLGWFQLRLAGGDIPATSRSDMEWVLAKAAGYNAGFSIATGLDALRNNGQTEAILEATLQWETARAQGAFTDEQRERLRDPTAEFQLRAAEGGWNLRPVMIAPARKVEKEERQPGEPDHTEWSVENPYEAQPIQAAFRAAAGSVQNIRLEIGFQSIQIPCKLESGQYLLLEGKRGARLADANWNDLGTAPLDGSLPTLASGNNLVRLAFEGAVSSAVEAVFKAVGAPESIPQQEPPNPSA